MVHKVWWVQAEALVGLTTLIPYLHQDEERRDYVERLAELINWVANHQMADLGYWHEDIDEFGNIADRPANDLWHAAYHSVRAAIVVKKAGQASLRTP